MNALRNNIKELRRRKGLTQADLASKACVTRKTINTIENGVFVPSTVLSLKIARILQSKFEDVFFLVDDTDE